MEEVTETLGRVIMCTYVYKQWLSLVYSVPCIIVPLYN